jgi:FMN phosphatase YigB (HAD superfamily)
MRKTIILLSGIIILSVLACGLYSIKHSRHVPSPAYHGEPSDSDDTQSEIANIEFTSDLLTKPAHAEQKNIIVDLNGVIFKDDPASIVSKIGIARVTNYTVTHWRNPVDLCMSILEKMGKDSQHISTIKLLVKEKQMPLCIVQWQQGFCSHGMVKEKIAAYINQLDAEKFFASTEEKELATLMLDIVFDPQELPNISKPVEPVVSLLSALKNQGCKIYVLANATDEAITILKKNYPSIFALFDGIMYSSKAQAVKSEEKIFTLMLETFHLKPADCVIIDTDKDSIALAKKLGIKGFVFTSAKAAKQQLKEWGIE